MTNDPYVLPKDIPAHIPKEIRFELEAVMQVLLDSDIPIAFVWLFGSYARGDYIQRSQPDENGMISVYFSDIDILVGISQTPFNHKERRTAALDETLRDHPALASRIHTIYITVRKLNKALLQGQYFYHEVVTEGVKLYDSGEIQLDTYQKSTGRYLQKQSRIDFEATFNKALDFQTNFEFDFLEQRYSLAAFELHQMTEHLFNTLILVFTNYRHRTHDLDFLEKQAASQCPPILGIFPRATKEERFRFNRLRDAYIDARYKTIFDFERHHLINVARSVARLQQVVFDACGPRIQSYRPHCEVEPYQPTQPFLDVDKLLVTQPAKKVIAQKEADLEASKKREEQERLAKEEALKRAEMAGQEKEKERLEKERLQELLRKAGIDPSQSD